MGAPLVVFGAAAGRGMPTSGRVDDAVQGRVRRSVPRRLRSGCCRASCRRLDHAGAGALLVAGRCGSGVRRCPTASSGRARAVRRASPACCCRRRRGGTARRARRRTDPLQPLAGIVAAAAKPDAQALAFRTIKSSRRPRSRTRAPRRPPASRCMLDFYADWCVSCKEMEKYTFADPTVQRGARRASCCSRPTSPRTTTTDQALMQRFGIFGPPATMFFAQAARAPRAAPGRLREGRGVRRAAARRAR